MGYDKARGGFGGGGGRGGFRGNQGGDFHKELFSATCATCQKECQVPFRPTGERPVYCKDCFRNAREGSGTDFTRPPAAPYGNKGNDRGPRRDFGGKPSFPPKASAAAPDTRIGDLQKQLAALHVKVDSLIALMARQPAAAPAKEEVVAEKKPAKAVKKTAKAKGKK